MLSWKFLLLQFLYIFLSIELSHIHILITDRWNSVNGKVIEIGDWFPYTHQNH